jgi:DNA polymerase III subunit delta'
MSGLALQQRLLESPEPQRERRYRSPDGAKRNPGRPHRIATIPDFAWLHPGYRDALVSDSDDESDVIEPRPPRETLALYGHGEAEHAFLDAYRSGRFAHSWLIGGPKGIGKATLAYRMARFVLVHPDPQAPEVRAAASLEIDAKHPVARRIAAQGQGDLLVLERTINEKTGKLYQDIRVEDVRRTVGFFGSTAGEGGWRVAIVDSVDELNPSGANALLKILEEPPRRALLLLVSHAAGRVLPTIHSRCRVLSLRPLSAADVARAAAAASDQNADASDIKAAAAAAEGSARRALDLLDSDVLDLRARIIALLERLPELDARALHAVGERISGTDPATLAAFLDTVNGWLSARLAATPQDRARLNRVAQAWEKVNAAARDVEEYNLERKPLVFNVFGWLAEATRG